MALVSACGARVDEAEAPKKGTELTVLAGLALEEALAQAGIAFERAHPGTKVELTFGHIPQLEAALDQGTRADVLVTHDEESLRRVLEMTRAVERPRIVARNQLVVVVPQGNPEGIRGLSDLGRAGTTFVMCRRELPCGRSAERLLGVAGVDVNPPLVSGGPAVVAEVARGEADAGIAFVTDVHGSEEKVDTVPIPTGREGTVGIPAVVLHGARPRGKAVAFLHFLTSPEGVAIFERHGFLAG